MQVMEDAGNMRMKSLKQSFAILTVNSEILYQSDVRGSGREKKYLQSVTHTAYFSSKIRD